MLAYEQIWLIFHHISSYYIISNSQKPLSGAEREAKRIQKLKSTNKYHEYLKKKVEAMKRNRAAKKEIERKVDKELNDVIQKRCAAIRERVRKSRAKAKKTSKLVKEIQFLQTSLSMIFNFMNVTTFPRLHQFQEMWRNTNARKLGKNRSCQQDTWFGWLRKRTHCLSKSKNANKFMKNFHFFSISQCGFHIFRLLWFDDFQKASTAEHKRFLDGMEKQ